jgi:hypothetical protein
MGRHAAPGANEAVALNARLCTFWRHGIQHHPDSAVALFAAQRNWI